MIATRRRGYVKEDKYPVIEVLHPDAFLFTWTGGTKTITASRNGIGVITKIILDGVTYEGETLSQVLTPSGWIGFVPQNTGHHEAYVYLKETGAWNGCLAFYYNDYDTFELIRFPRQSCRSYATGYKWGSFMFTGDYIKYLSYDIIIYSTIYGNIYIPYNLEVDEDNSLYKNKYVRVKYKFIEDE